MAALSMSAKEFLQRYDFPLTCALFSIGALYSLGWVAIEFLVFMGLWPTYSDFDAVAFEASVGPINQLAFYGLNVANIVTAMALLRRSKWALAFFALSFLLGLLDWVLLTFNPYFDAHIHGYVIFGIEAYVVWRLYRHVSEGRLS